jgi:hypothetical protein
MSIRGLFEGSIFSFFFYIVLFRNSFSVSFCSVLDINGFLIFPSLLS